MELSVATTAAYLRHSFEQLLGVVDRLGDELVNERPVGEATNTVTALVVHCCGVTEFWLGHIALGRPSSRDRDAEFVATATVAELHALVETTLATACDDIARLDAGEGTAVDDPGRHGLPGDDATDTSDAATVLHVLEELYQHLGHAELTADVLLGGASSP